MKGKFIQVKTAIYIKGRKLNLIPWIIVISLIVLTVGGTLLWVYVIEPAAIRASRVQLEYDPAADSYYDPEKKITYLRAPVYYQAGSVLSDPVYGMAGERLLYRVGTLTSDAVSGDKLTLESASDWLSVGKERGMLLYYNKDSVTVPKIGEFEPETVYICSTTDLTAAQSEMGASIFFPKGFFDGGCENFYEGEEYEDSTLFRQLRVSSSKYGFMQMVLYLYKNEKTGDYYIYLPQEKIFAAADSDMLDIFFKSYDEAAGSGESGK